MPLPDSYVLADPPAALVDPQPPCRPLHGRQPRRGPRAVGPNSRFAIGSPIATGLL
jgi:hypothetical protein